MNALFDHSLADWLSRLCDGGASIGCVYLMVVCLIVVRFNSHKQATERRLHEPRSAVSILKPLHGAEADLLRRLASFCRQEYRASIQIVCGTQDRNDSAIGVVTCLLREYPGKEIELVIDSHNHGRNRKVSNLANMATRARNDILVIADSDIEVGPGYLNNVVMRLQHAGVGVVTCPYHGTAKAGIWSEFAALSINTHFLPDAVAALTLGLAQPCFGATIALRKELLGSIGGFQAFADCLADDYAIGAAVRARGYEVAVAPFSVEHACLQKGMREFISQRLRVARTIKALDPVGYLGTVITHPFPLALLAAALGGSASLFLVALALACRITLCHVVERTFGLPRQRYWLLPCHDLFAFAIFVFSFLGTTVNWRGYSYRVKGDATLIGDPDGGLS
jgi:ceramide glucosyltransferase